MPVDASSHGGADVDLPSDRYRYLLKIRDDDACRLGMLVNTIGFAKDYRPPVPTRGGDYKAQVQLADLSIDSDYSSCVQFNIFRPIEQMPADINAGDIVMALNAKIQRYGMGEKSLLSNRITQVLVFDKNLIPKYPQSAKVALKPTARPVRITLSDKEYQYVSWIHQKADKSDIPDDDVFTERKKLSLQVKNKFCLLKDVKPDTFHDLVVQLVRDPHDLGDKMTLWVSDYTENENFFGYNSEEGGRLARDDDEFGYTTGYTSQPTNLKWKGPQGKLSMQITCYEPHALFLREYLGFGDWITLKNVQIKYGSNNANIEGFLREDRRQDRLQVIEHDIDNNRDALDSRVKDALRRKRIYEKGVNKALKHAASVKPKSTNDGSSPVADNNKKRSAEDAGVPAKPNARKRRKQKRAAALTAQEKQEKESLDKELNLNPHIRCEHSTEPLTPIPDIIEPFVYKTTIDGEAERIPLPFMNANYRTVGRVVDFWPNNIRKFATWRLKRDTDILSDDDDDDDDEDDSHDASDGDILDDQRATQETLGQYRGQGVWEWRFSLQLEDTYPSKSKGWEKKKRFWVIVDNYSAQLLLSMNAVDLSRNDSILEDLKEKLFTLWGDLEERKTKLREATRLPSRALRDAPPDSPDGEFGPGRAKILRARNIDSQVLNKPFPCCIKQYGVKVRPPRGEKPNASSNKSWQRVFTLFGVKISASS
ncbi:uncharacterized protein MKZ38_000868 [Zalerion maritima]|uniref:Protection of telomeres protein 1 n=1 Tax=Zalerion maritima TaxID=339359 RepID=A0AAD5RZB8_9PEZI|nr:uncharacterized protein MKZ38_000868 [Zalerion maritima]